MANVHLDLIIGVCGEHRLPRSTATARSLLHAAWFYTGLIRSSRTGSRRPISTHSQGREVSGPSCAGADKTRVVINLKTAKALGLAVPPRSLSPPTRSRIYFRLRTDLIVHDFAISRARLSVANYLA